MSKRTDYTLDATCPVEWGHPLNQGLVAHWMVPPLSGWRGGTTLRDLVRGGKTPNDGTLTNGPTWVGGSSRPGGYGALSLDGSDDFVACTGNFGVSGQSAFSFGGWIYWDDAAWSSDFPSFIGNTTVGSNGNGLSFTVREGRPAVDFWNTRQRVDNALSVQTWYHVFGTHSGGVSSPTSGTTKVYIDGLSVATSTEGADTISTSDSAVVIGRLNDAVGRYFKGGLDDLIIYPNRALSASEVYALYDQSRRGHPDTLRWLGTRVYSLPQPPPAQGNFHVGGEEKEKFLDPCCPVNWQHPLNRGLASWWMVPPNSGWRGGLTLRDLVRGGKTPHDGTLTNGPTWVGGGRSGGYGALSFASASSQYVDVGATGLLVLTDDPGFFVSGWFRPAVIDGNWHSVCSKVNANNTNRQFFIGVNGGYNGTTNGLSFFTSFGGDGAVGTGALTANRWYWFLASHKGTGAVGNQLWVWSVEGGWETVTSGPNGPTNTGIDADDGTNPINLGRFNSGSGLYFDGQIDDVRHGVGGGHTFAQASLMLQASRRGHPDTLRWLSTRAWFVPTGGGGTTETPSPISLPGSVVSPSLALSYAMTAVVLAATVAAPTITLSQPESPVGITGNAVTHTLAIEYAANPVAGTFSVPSVTTSGDVVERPNPVVITGTVPAVTTSSSLDISAVTGSLVVVAGSVGVSQPVSPIQATGTLVAPDTSLVSTPNPAVLPASVVSPTESLMIDVQPATGSFTAPGVQTTRTTVANPVSLISSLTVFTTSLVKSVNPIAGVFTVPGVLTSGDELPTGPAGVVVMAYVYVPGGVQHQAYTPGAYAAEVDG